MFGVFADDPDYPFPFNDLALAADTFYRSFYFHTATLTGLPTEMGHLAR
jgi:hypothetical protein